MLKLLSFFGFCSVSVFIKAYKSIGFFPELHHINKYDYYTDTKKFHHCLEGRMQLECVVVEAKSQELWKWFRCCDLSAVGAGVVVFRSHS